MLQIQLVAQLLFFCVHNTQHLIGFVSIFSTEVRTTCAIVHFACCDEEMLERGEVEHASRCVRSRAYIKNDLHVFTERFNMQTAQAYQLQVVWRTYLSFKKMFFFFYCFHNVLRWIALLHILSWVIWGGRGGGCWNSQIPPDVWILQATYKRLKANKQHLHHYHTMCFTISSHNIDIYLMCTSV